MPIIKQCELCGVEFKVSPYLKDIAKYCSSKCFYECFYKDKKVKKICLECKKEFEVKKCRKNIAKYCSQKCAYKNIQKYRIGIKRTDEVKEKISKNIKEQFENGRKSWNKGKIGVQKGVRGSKNNLWRGGTSKLWQNITNSYQYKNWRLQVFKRDNFICKKCGSNKKLEAHHIKAKSVILRNFLNKNKTKNIKEIFKNCPKIIDINNGLTLCRNCHRQTDNYAGSNKKNI